AVVAGRGLIVHELRRYRDRDVVGLSSGHDAIVGEERIGSKEPDGSGACSAAFALWCYQAEQARLYGASCFRRTELASLLLLYRATKSSNLGSTGLSCFRRAELAPLLLLYRATKSSNLGSTGLSCFRGGETRKAERRSAERELAWRLTPFISRLSSRQSIRRARRSPAARPALRACAGRCRRLRSRRRWRPRAGRSRGSCGVGRMRRARCAR